MVEEIVTVPDKDVFDEFCISDDQVWLQAVEDAVNFAIFSDLFENGFYGYGRRVHKNDSRVSCSVHEKGTGTNTL